jgi:hypothetical protein
MANWDFDCWESEGACWRCHSRTVESREPVRMVLSEELGRREREQEEGGKGRESAGRGRKKGGQG